jgi:hypothetical protein
MGKLSPQGNSEAKDIEPRFAQINANEDRRWKIEVGS